VRRSRGVFNTDQVNRDRMLCPASELMRAEERHQRECLERGVAPGMPSNVGHDMHRLIGWTRPLGLYIDGRMVRVLGAIDEAVTEEEKVELQARGETYWTEFHREGAEPFREELIARLGSVDLAHAQYIRIEAVAAKRIDLAVELYPDLFKPGVGLVDKDGLVDYRKLLKRMKQIQPGVFHDSKRDLLLFAHRFHRRSLSHRNKLNTYFLQSFDAIAEESPELTVRLKLDPDLVGHPASATNLIELEYWRGPHFNDDISSIPDGVAEHKADERIKFYEGVDRTQIWWKAPESRQREDSSISNYRTFEIEELIENPSGGLAENHFGCRYAHAEFAACEATISHFDGAIRAYAGDSYLDRIDTSIDRAGKRADYTKLFRFDGNLTVGSWKRLLSDFFRGNKLIPEYLGAPSEVDQVRNEPRPQAEVCGLELAALISLEHRSITGPITLGVERLQQIGDEVVPFIEVGRGKVANYLRARFDLTAITSVSFADDILNAPRILFAPSDVLKTKLATEVTALAEALRDDVEADLIRHVAVAFSWENDRIVTTLSLAGKAQNVVNILVQLSGVVDPTKPASDWIEPLSDLIKTVSRPRRSEVSWDGVDSGMLEIPRHGELLVDMSIPKNVQEQLQLGSSTPMGETDN
jgi:hypothetical protein